LDPWKCIALLLEIGFGIVPMVYMVFDFDRVGDNPQQHMYRVRVFSSIPIVLMAKQLGRCVVGLVVDPGSGSGQWWYHLLNLAQVLFYVLFGGWNAENSGDLWFLIYCSAPVALSWPLLEYMLSRMYTLLQANEQLMKAAFAAVVWIDSSDGCYVFESNPGFDIVVDGEAHGLKLETMFTATPQHFEQLCSPSSDTDQVVRRLKTKLVSLSKAFRQDVELRVVAAPEHKAQMEHSRMLVGVALMGERAPFLQEHTTDSFIIEQYLDEIGQLRVAGKENMSGTVSELGATTSFPDAGSVMVHGLRRRRGSQLAASKAMPKINTTVEGVECRCAFPRPWKEAFSRNYLKECSMSNIENLLSSWNHAHKKCCNWHAALDRLARLVTQMHGWHTCDVEWPRCRPLWQCSACSALQFSAEEAFCWLCFAAKELP